jgi:hypothetical protein
LDINSKILADIYKWFGAVHVSLNQSVANSRPFRWLGELAAMGGHWRVFGMAVERLDQIWFAAHGLFARSQHKLIPSV